ncbi:MAG: hypothetical protein U0M42_09315 [Acutalibacteraceae bacterium]|nr:hypothetical protein [Acutalibacteraceae bacterium]
MKFPTPKTKGKKSRTAIGMTGIITAHDPLSLRNDKLSFGSNLWNDEGIITNRPAFFKSGGLLSENGYLTDEQKVFFADFPFTEVFGYSSLMALVREVYYERTEISFYAVNNTAQTKHLFTIELVPPNMGSGYEVKNILFIKDTARKGNGIYIIIPTKSVSLSTGETVKQVKYYEMNSDCSGTHFVSTNSFYCPLVMKNGRGRQYIEHKDVPVKPTVYPESPNILNGAFEADYFCDDESHQYVLPYTVTQDSEVKIYYYTNPVSFKYFRIPPNEEYSDTQHFMNIDLYFKIDRSTGIVTSYNGNEIYALQRMSYDNSIRICAYTDTVMTAYELLSRRIKPINCDCRLFLTGGEKNGHKIFYSGKNKPLYFCEKNSFEVGDDMGDITALSQQNRYIIAFKEREVYRISINGSAELSDDKLRNDISIDDVPRPTAKVVRITNFIGCDRPQTIKICGNRVVWYHSDGAVYTLYGSNLYTEGSVYELSADIKNSLKALSEEEKKHMRAFLINGYYGLSTGSKIFLMDSLVSGFVYLSGHKSADKKYSGLSWFYWETPKDYIIVDSFMLCGNTYFVMADRYTNCFFISSLSGNSDLVYDKDGNPTAVPISYSFATALLGDSEAELAEILIRAHITQKATIELFDENQTVHSFEVEGKNAYRNYVIPMYCRKGKIGIRIKGAGTIRLGEIKIEKLER